MSGGGWVHTSTPYVAASGRGDVWAEEAAAQGRRGTQRIVRAGEATASAEVAGLLGIPEGSAVVERRRLIHLDGRTVESTRTYWPVAIAGGTALTQARKIKGGAVALLAELGHAAHVVREEVRARMPDDDERAVLGLGPSDPVLQLVRQTLDGEGAPFQVDVSVFAAPTQRLRYELRVGQGAPDGR
ncbi:GntR family transcriptional regulator [Streptomyces sp. G-5]|uniref:GntR family transcriptional regulator n=1 Tax=Streptomyces TaxID=1883 RepID=UPI001908AD02|nr:UTRA domain-containing protein [Streptomyces sp. G-5]MCU4745662.1 UTRA domain-containing protein [Streptomyces sp. G-5]QQN79356.1 UTRA domain-containing protein [Streptomyces sp. XC 2026]